MIMFALKTNNNFIRGELAELNANGGKIISRQRNLFEIIAEYMFYMQMFPNLIFGLSIWRTVLWRDKICLRTAANQSKNTGIDENIVAFSYILCIAS